MGIVAKAFRYWRQHGLAQLARRVADAPARRLRRALRTGPDRQAIRAALARHPGRQAIIFLPLLDWDCPLFQRPHHLAMELARQGYTYFFVTGNVLTSFHGVKEVSDGCYVTDRLDLLLGEAPDAVLHVYSTDNNDRLELLRSHLAAGRQVLYEFIDEIHPSLSGQPIPESTWQRHAMLLGNEGVCVAASADRLMDEVLKARGSGRNVAFVPNAADVEHFSPAARDLSTTPELRGIVDGDRPVLGYFGALASWLDYELVGKLARAFPECDVVLIGYDYDGSLAGFDRRGLSNTHILGPVKYQVLPRYAAWFDVALIPFVINDITLSTSPIKLFEYMAMGLPVVTTAMPECRKQPLVLVAEDHAGFVAHVRIALERARNPEHARQLRREVREKHSWTARAAQLAALLKKTASRA